MAGGCTTNRTNIYPTSTILVEAVEQGTRHHASDGGLGGGGGGNKWSFSLCWYWWRIFPTYDYQIHTVTGSLKTQVVQVQTTLAAVAVEMVKELFLGPPSNRWNGGSGVVIIAIPT